MAMAGAAILLVVVVVVVAIGAEALSPPRRDYCRNRRPSECCRNVRDDDCTVPIDDTFCYCDDFCLEGQEIGGGKADHEDCCPDFREVCLGEGPGPLYSPSSGNETAVCIHKGKPLNAGKYTLNCNECSCQNGRLTCEEDDCLVDEEVIRKMNQEDSRLYGWTVTNYSMFWGRKVKEGLLLRTGTLQPDAKTLKLRPIRLHPELHRIPLEFDARQKPGWGGLISGVRDQGWCGASWIFSTLDVAQDRQMILSGRRPVSLSAQELLSCTSPKMDCKGGYINLAWGYLRKHGAMEEKCYPYASGLSGEASFCHRDSRFSTCKKYKTEPAYRISKKVQDIQWEIMTNGPVQALMKVHPDLFMYSGGVYQCPETDIQETTGMHSVRILGWGVDYTCMYYPVKYWVVANSWGTNWGENGLFRIQRGTNECDIESFVLAVMGRNDSMAQGRQ